MEHKTFSRPSNEIFYEKDISRNRACFRSRKSCKGKTLKQNLTEQTYSDTSNHGYDELTTEYDNDAKCSHAGDEANTFVSSQPFDKSKNNETDTYCKCDQWRSQPKNLWGQNVRF